MKVGLVGGTGIRGGRDRLGTRLRAIQDGYGEVSNPGDAPFWTTFRGGGTSRSTVAPDGKVEGEDSWHVGPGWGVVGRGEEGVVEGKGSWKGETDLGKERGTGLANDGTRAVYVGDGVLVSSAKEAGWNVIEGDLVLVSHPSKGG